MAPKRKRDDSSGSWYSTDGHEVAFQHFLSQNHYDTVRSLPVKPHLLSPPTGPWTLQNTEESQWDGCSLSKDQLTVTASIIEHPSPSQVAIFHQFSDDSVIASKPETTLERMGCLPSVAHCYRLASHASHGEFEHPLHQLWYSGLSSRLDCWLPCMTRDLRQLTAKSDAMSIETNDTHYRLLTATHVINSVLIGVLLADRRATLTKWLKRNHRRVHQQAVVAKGASTSPADSDILTQSYDKHPALAEQILSWCISNDEAGDLPVSPKLKDALPAVLGFHRCKVRDVPFPRRRAHIFPLFCSH